MNDKNISKRIITSATMAAAIAAGAAANAVQVFASDTGDPVEGFPVDAAEATLTQANQSVESAKQTLDIASENLAEAQNKVSALTAQKSEADQKLSDAQNQLALAKLDLEQMKAKADGITQNDIDTAQAAVDNANAAFTEAQQVADDALNALNTANTELDSANANYTSAQSTYSQAVSAQENAQAALEAAQEEQAQAEVQARDAEEANKKAAEQAQEAERNAEEVAAKNPNAEETLNEEQKNSEQAQEEAEEAQKEATDAETAKNTAEAEKNSAETDANNASAAVADATQTVNDKATDVTNAENAQTASQTTLDNANKTLDAETAKAGDAQAKADQEVKDQRNVVDQAVAKKAEADQALEDAKAEQTSKQADLDNANAKLDAAKAEQANAEKVLKAKQDKLIEAQETLDNAKGDVTSKKKAVADAQTAVTNAEKDLESKTAEVEKLKAESTDQQTALDNARKEVESAQTQVDAANAELKKFEDTTLYQQIYVTGDPNKPVPNESMSIFAPVIPEANGAKVTFTVDKNYDTYYSKADKVCESLNTTGSYTPAKRTIYYYKEDLGYSGYDTPQEGRELAYTDVDVDGEGTNKVAHIVANWTDSEGQSHTKNVVLEVEKYDYKWVKNYVKSEAQRIVSEIITDNMTSEQKAKAITDYVMQHYEYNMSSSAYSMLTTGGADCWGATDLVCAIGDAAGFKTTIHWDNYTNGMGKGHMNAWLYSPSDDKYYQCEAGMLRKKDPETGLCGSRDSQGNFIPAEGITFNIPIDEDAVEVDRTPGVYGIEYGTETVVSGAEPINNVIASFYAFEATEIHVPTDPEYNTLGGRRDSYFKDGPFSKFTRLKTVYVGANITTINQNAYAHYEGGNYTNNVKEGWYDNPYGFVVDENNPKYCSDENGNLYEKNADGTRGKLLHTPGLRYKEVTDDEYYENISKTNAQNASDYEAVNKTVTDARNAYNSANTKYENLMKDDFAKTITDAEDRKQAAQNLLDAAKSNKTIADSALTTANQMVNEAETAKTNAENDVSTATQRVTTAQNAVDEAKKPVITAEHALNDAKANVSDKQTAVTNAQKAVDDAKKVLADKEEAAKQGAPESLINARSAVYTAQADLDAKKQALTDANKALEKAKKDLADKQSALKKANTTLEAKKQALEQREETLKQKQLALADANANVETAHKALEDASAAYNEVVNANNAYANATQTLSQTADKLTAAKNNLANAKEKVANAKESANNATETVEKLTKELGIAKDIVEARKLTVEEARETYDAKASALELSDREKKQAAKKLSELTDAINNRDSLIDKVSELEKEVEDGTKTVNTLTDQLSEARELKNAAQLTYDDALNVYNKLVDAEEAKNGKAELDVNNNTISYSAAEISVNTDGSLTFRSNADYKKFKEVQVDGKTVDPSQYTASEGSTVIVLHKSFVDTLSKGNHTITIVSEDGSATTSFVLNDKGASVLNNNTAKTNNTSRSSEAKAYISATPDTSDVTESAPWVFMVVVSLVTVGGVVYLKHSHE